MNLIYLIHPVQIVIPSLTVTTINYNRNTIRFIFITYAFLEPFQKSMLELFYKNALVNYFSKKALS